MTTSGHLGVDPVLPKRLASIFDPLTDSVAILGGSLPLRRVKNQLPHALRMLHRIQPGPLSAGGPPEQVDLAHASELCYVLYCRVDISGGRLDTRPILICLVGMTIAVNINGPDVVAIRGEHIHQRVVPNLKVEIRTSRPRAAMHKKCNFSANSEGVFRPGLVLFPQINSQTIPQRVVCFPRNGFISGVKFLRSDARGIAGTRARPGE